jgi:hypothetical protein
MDHWRGLLLVSPIPTTLHKANRAADAETLPTPVSRRTQLQRTASRRRPTKTARRLTTTDRKKADDDRKKAGADRKKRPTLTELSSAANHDQKEKNRTQKRPNIKRASVFQEQQTLMIRSREQHKGGRAK